MRGPVAAAVLSCLSLTLAPLPAPAQVPDPSAAGPSAPPSAAVSGVVVSQDGLRLPGATIVMRPESGLRAVTVVANELGYYQVTALVPGTYELTAAMAGFRSVTRGGLALNPGETALVDVTLEVAGLQETISVAAALPRDSLETSGVRASSGRDVGEALSELTGVTKVRRGGIASDIVVRGYQGRNLTVLINGVRLYGACPNNMDPAAFHADFAEVERIEVGKGPFDVRNQGSLGGVLNIVTKRPDRGVRLDTSLSTGSSRFANPSATFSLGRSRWAALGGVSYRRSAPYADGSGRAFTELTNYLPDAVNRPAFGVGTAWAKGHLWSGSGRSVQVAYTHQDADRVLYPYLQMDALTDVADRVSVAYQDGLDRWAVRGLRAQAYYTRVAHWMTDEYRQSSLRQPRPYSMATDARTGTAGGRVDATLGGVDLGIEAFTREWSSTTMMARSAYQPQYALPSATMRSIGAYAEHTRAAGMWRFDVGGRVDRVHSFVDAARANTDLFQAYKGTRLTSVVDLVTSAKARLTAVVSPELTVSAGVGRTVRVPDPQERFFALKRMPTDWVGNPLLKPATNTGLDVSSAYRRGGLTLSLSAYYDSLRNYVAVHGQPRIEAVPGIMNLAARSFANVDARIRGGEIDASLALTDRLSLSGSLSHTRGTRDPRPDSGIVTADLPEMPAARSRVAVRYQSARLSAEVEGVGVGAQTRVDTTLGEAPTPRYALVNMRAAWTAGPLKITVALNNVFDETYSEHLSYQRDPFRAGVRVYEPGRNVYAGVSAGF